MAITPERIAAFRREKAMHESLVSSDDFRRGIVELISDCFVDVGVIHTIEIDEDPIGHRWAFFDCDDQCDLGRLAITLTPSGFGKNGQPAIVEMRWEHDGGSSCCAASFDSAEAISSEVERLHDIAIQAFEQNAAVVEELERSSV